MEKRVVLAIVLCLAIAVGWFAFVRPKPPAAKPPRQGTPAMTAAEQPQAPPQPVPQAEPPPPKPEAEPKPQAAPKPQDEAPATSLSLEEPGRQFKFGSAGGGSILDHKLWDCPYHAPGNADVLGDPGHVTMAPDGEPGTLSVGIVGDPAAERLELRNWHMEAVGDRGVRSWIEVGGVRVEKTITLGGPHDLAVEIRVLNISANPGADRLLKIRGPWTPQSLAHIPEDGVLFAETGEDCAFLRADEALKETLEHPGTERRAARGWRYIGTRADFYLGALVPSQPLDLGTVVTMVGFSIKDASPGAKPNAAWPCVSAAFQIPFKVPAKDATAEWRFMLYAGPNSRAVTTVEPYTPVADAYINRTFLWMSFGPIGRLLGWLLQGFASTGMGYGFAVCCLTILVRGCLFPLSRKSQLSMKMHSLKMARIKPRLDAVREKFKDKPKQLNQETMKVMREEKMQILPAGCLLAFLQMPIWISLYATLQTQFEMRHAPFLWIKDLTAPDHLVALPWAQHWPILNGWFNLLPLLMVATWWGSSAMMPLPDDPEQRQQAKMMRWIPLLFGFFMYSTASGLTLYMTLSALWSIGESWLIRKVWLSKLELQPAVEIIPPASRKLPPKR